MKVLRVKPDSSGLAKRLRWVLEADFSVKHGLVPSFGERVNAHWDEALVVYEAGQVRAVLRYDRVKTPGGGLLAGGTWVAPELRGQGVALDLWKRALRGHRTVEVTTVSRAGKALVQSLRQRYPHVSWVTNKD